MQKPPNRNLTPDAEQWGRWAEQSILLAGQNLAKQVQSTTNTLTAINGALTQLSEQVAELSRITVRTYPTYFPTSLVVNANTSGAQTFSADGPEITFTPTTDSTTVVTMSARSLDMSLSASVPVGSILSALLTFEIVGNPNYTLGSARTSTFFQQVSTNGQLTVLAVPAHKVVQVVGLPVGVPQTVRMRLCGYNSAGFSGRYEASDPFLSVQTVPST